MHNKLIIFVFFLVCDGVNAQNAAVLSRQWRDSLTSVHANEKKVDLLYKLGTIHYDSMSYDSALFYLQQLVQIPHIEKQSKAEFWASLCDNLGMAYAHKLKMDKAIHWLEKGAKFVQTHKVSSEVKCKLYGHLMEINFARDDSKKTQQASQLYIQEAYHSKDSSHITIATLNLAFFLFKQQNYAQAEKKLKQALDLITRSHDKRSLAILTGYEGSIALNKNDLATARKKFNTALELCKQYRPRQALYYELRLAGVDILEGKLDTAISILKRCKSTVEETGDSRNLTIYLSLSVEVLKAQHKYQEALQLLLDKIYQVEGEFQSWIKLQIPDLYVSLGMYKEAFQSLDSLYYTQEAKLNSANEVTKQMELQQQAEQNKLQRIQQQLKTQAAKNIARRNLLGMITALVLAALIYVLLRNRLLREKNRSLQHKADAHKKAEELRAFNYSIGHDLKTPIDNALLFLNRFEQKFKVQDQEGKEYLQRMELVLEDTRAMIGGMLNYAEQDQIPLFESQIDTQQEVTKLAESFKVSEPVRHIEIEVGALPVVRGDKLMLRQVLSNLISNAVKFTSHRPLSKIQVYSKLREGYWDIYVEDNGVGIPESGMAQVFKLFKTAHDRSEYPGTGVGLAIVKRIVERHEGSVWAFNNQGEGATFGFSIPVR